MTTAAAPAVEGWFTTDGPPALVGLRCAACGTSVFPPTATTCPNPACRGDELAPTPLARTGRVWSWAVNHYAPPAPYVAAEPFEPVTIVAVTLDDEAITVLGQFDGDPSAVQLSVGLPVEVTLGEIGWSDGETRTMYRFRPTTGDRS